MTTIEQVKKAIQMWENGSTHGTIKTVVELTHEEEFAITEVGYSLNMTAERIHSKLPKLQPGMKSGQIRIVMDS